MHCTVDSLRSFPTSESFRAFYSTNLYSVSRCPFFLLKEFLNSKPQMYSQQRWIWISHVFACQIHFFLPLSKSLQSWSYGPGPGVDRTFDFYGNDSKCFMHITHVDRCIDFKLNYWTIDLKDNCSPWLCLSVRFALMSPRDVCRPTNILINLLHIEYTIH